ncbi:hypothetical protein VTK26DRAFT_6398 [Humicola hyalothermophila]
MLGLGFRVSMRRRRAGRWCRVTQVVVGRGRSRGRSIVIVGGGCGGRARRRWPRRRCILVTGRAGPVRRGRAGRWSIVVGCRGAHRRSLRRRRPRRRSVVIAWRHCTLLLWLLGIRLLVLVLRRHTCFRLRLEGDFAQGGPRRQLLFVVLVLAAAKTHVCRR